MRGPPDSAQRAYSTVQTANLRLIDLQAVVNGSLASWSLDAAAASLQATPMQVALLWLLQRSPNIVLIPGTSSLEHLRENLKAAMLQLPSEIIANLDSNVGELV
jgi:aryl-alcohol dehydrogenase-like predicted oxidoreductase